MAKGKKPKANGHAPEAPGKGKPWEGLKAGESRETHEGVYTHNGSGVTFTPHKGKATAGASSAPQLKQLEIPGAGRKRIKELDAVCQTILEQKALQKDAKAIMEAQAEVGDRLLKKHELPKYLFVDGEREFELFPQEKKRMVVKERKRAKNVDQWRGPKRQRAPRLGADQRKARKAAPPMPSPGSVN